MKHRSSLLPFLDRIRQLKASEPRIDCEDIRQRLALHVQAEQVRRFCHQHNIPVNPPRTTFGAKNRSWKGGRILDKHGYVLVRQLDHPQANSGGYVREHRLVMEACIGRYLLQSEVVHHVNDDNQDNRVENLRLYSANSHHLADTLKGKVPNWTPEGRARILAAVRRPLRKPRASASQPASETDAGPSR